MDPRIHCTPCCNLSCFCAYMDKGGPKIRTKMQRTPNVRNTLRGKKDTCKRLLLPQTKTSYQSTMTKTMSHLQKDGHKGRGHSTASPEMTLAYIDWFSTRAPTARLRERTVFSASGAGRTEQPHEEERRWASPRTMRSHHLEVNHTFPCKNYNYNPPEGHRSQWAWLRRWSGGDESWPHNRTPGCVPKVTENMSIPKPVLRCSQQRYSW